MHVLAAAARLSFLLCGRLPGHLSLLGCAAAMQTSCCSSAGRGQNSEVSFGEGLSELCEVAADSALQETG